MTLDRYVGALLGLAAGRLQNLRLRNCVPVETRSGPSSAIRRQAFETPPSFQAGFRMENGTLGCAFAGGGRNPLEELG
jgi:hypothetical protein